MKSGQPVDTSDIATLARLHAASKDDPSPGEAVIGTVITESIAGRTGPVALRRYLPPAHGTSRAPAILFFHADCSDAEDFEHSDRLCRQLAALSGIQIIAVQYRRASKREWASAIEDCIDSYSMLLAGMAEWKIDTQRIAVMGNGTGCTLAILVSIHARDMCQPMPVAQLLLDPADGGDAPDAPSTTGGAALHMRGVKGLPPTFIATIDPLHRPSQSLIRRLRAEGVATTLYCAGDLGPPGDTAADNANALLAASDFVHRALAASRSPAQRRRT